MDRHISQTMGEIMEDSKVNQQATKPKKNLGTFDKLMLHYQRLVGRTLIGLTYFTIWSWMYYYLGYRFPQAAALRKQFAKIKGQSKEPFLICANHLTMIDSFIITWALGSNLSFMAWGK